MALSISLLLMVTFLSYISQLRAQANNESPPFTPDQSVKVIARAVDQMREELTLLRTKVALDKVEINRQISAISTELTNTANTLRQADAELNSTIDSSTQSLSGQLLKINQQVSTLSSVAVSRCRVCFQETEGSAACQGNRYSCSGWSTSALWTAPFRDDTDDRVGGCTYQWMIQCE
jgi:hypothetical protein